MAAVESDGAICSDLLTCLFPNAFNSLSLIKLMDKLGNRALFRNGVGGKCKKKCCLARQIFETILHTSGMQQTVKCLCPLKAPL